MLALQDDIEIIEKKLKKMYEKDRDKKEKKAMDVIVTFTTMLRSFLENQSKLVLF